ncbi:MAG: GNAT family N-acetyltransferase, partial [Candidatus Hydrogenedentes bacterium]|nr:GNAT family N-acetyltransferase [Candidatus Hydrogenedentota bacterium]
YMHSHPHIKKVDLRSIGVWEAGGEVVGVVHPEHSLGTAYFEFDPDYGALKREMLAYAEEHISAAKPGGKSLAIYINDGDDEFQSVATEMGYAKTDRAEQMSHFVIPDPFPTIPLPDGFRVKSLAEDNDFAKLNRVVFRGFNHGDEPTDDGVEDRKFMQSAPNYKMDLNIVVEAPGGDFVSYCGMWYESVRRIAYVEPVCTDPDYRRMGLASAAVLEGIRRCGGQGATVAYVGAILPVYLSIGFRQIFNCSEWRRAWA